MSNDRIKQAEGSTIQVSGVDSDAAESDFYTIHSKAGIGGISGIGVSVGLPISGSGIEGKSNGKSAHSGGSVVLVRARAS